MIARTGVAQERMHVVYNGIDTRGYAAREALPSPPRIGFFSRICEAKGIDTLIDAFIHLRTQLGDTQTHLTIAGAMTKQDVRFLAPYKDRLKKLGLWQDVELQPNVSKTEKQSILRSLTLLSVPATYDEAFGLYLAEAMSCGVPVVQPDRGAFPELLRVSGGGLLHRPGDAVDLATKWKSLLDDPAKNAILGKRAREYAMREFSVKTMADSIIDVYTTVMELY